MEEYATILLKLAGNCTMCKLTTYPCECPTGNRIVECQISIIDIRTVDLRTVTGLDNQAILLRSPLLASDVHIGLCPDSLTQMPL